MNACDILKQYLCDDIVNYIFLDYMKPSKNDIIYYHSQVIEQIDYLMCVYDPTRNTKFAYSRYLFIMFKRIKYNNKYHYFNWN